LTVGATAKASGHSDYVDTDEAKRRRGEQTNEPEAQARVQVVQVDVRPAMGIAKEVRVI
jgi:hypothetical protein